MIIKNVQYNEQVKQGIFETSDSYFIKKLAS